MHTIYKFELPLRRYGDDLLEIEMPVGAQILHVGLDAAGTPCLWAEVLTEVSKAKRQVWVMGTGIEFPESLRQASDPIPEYRGSFNEGPFVWHVYA